MNESQIRSMKILVDKYGFSAEEAIEIIMNGSDTVSKDYAFQMMERAYRAGQKQVNDSFGGYQGGL